MSEHRRPPRFVCYPNGDVEDRERATAPGGTETDRQPVGRSSAGVSGSRTAAGGTAGLLVLVMLLRVFHTGSDREPERDGPAAVYRDGAGTVSPDLQRTLDALRDSLERRTHPPRTDRTAAAVALLDATQKHLTNVAAVLDRAGDNPRLNPPAERALDQIDTSLDLLEDLLCRCAADGPPPPAPPTLDTLLQQLATLREQSAALRLRLRPAAPLAPNGQGGAVTAP